MSISNCRKHALNFNSDTEVKLYSGLRFQKQYKNVEKSFRKYCKKSQDNQSLSLQWHHHALDLDIASFVGCEPRSYICMSPHPLIYLWIQMSDQSIHMERLHYLCKILYTVTALSNWGIEHKNVKALNQDSVSLPIILASCQVQLR